MRVDQLLQADNIVWDYTSAFRALPTGIAAHGHSHQRALPPTGIVLLRVLYLLTTRPSLLWVQTEASEHIKSLL